MFYIILYCVNALFQINWEQCISVPIECEDELPTINPPKRRRGKRRASKSNTSAVDAMTPGQDAERLAHDFPLHNWLENKINELQRNKSGTTGQKPYSAGVGGAANKPKSTCVHAVGVDQDKQNGAIVSLGEPRAVTGDGGSTNGTADQKVTDPCTTEKDISVGDTDCISKLVISDVCGGTSNAPFIEQQPDSGSTELPLLTEQPKAESDDARKNEAAATETELIRYAK